MAVFDLRNPSGLYTGGSAVFNPHDYTAIAQAARNRKAAKDEAIDNYYKNLPNTLNDKGVRDVDIPTIAKAKDVLQQYWAQNKDAIRKGNTPQALELQKRFREIGDLVNQSKSRAQTDLQLGKAKLSGKSDYVFASHDFIPKLSAHNKPIGAPGSKGIDIATDFTAPEPFDENKYRKNFADIKFNEGVPEISEHPTDKYLMVKTPTYNLGDDAKKVIYERAADAYHNDLVFKRKIDVDLAGTGQIPRLMESYQKTFGKPIQTPEDLAAAYTLSQLPSPQVKPTTIPNTDLINREREANKLGAEQRRQQFAKAMQADRQAFQREMLKTREAYKNTKEEERVNDVDTFIDGEIQEATQNPQTVKGIIPNIGGMDVYTLKTSPSVLEAFKQKDESSGHEYTPSAIVYNRNNGNFILVGAAKNGGNVEIPRAEYRASLVNHLFNTKVKLGQINTNRTVSGGKTKTTESGSKTMTLAERMKAAKNK